MKTNYSISIPKPCHEDWSKMTPNEKGRFCFSCSKTVVDFTKMSPDEIQDYIANNKNQRICGHIKQSQLDTINLKIPEAILVQPLSFHRVFLLALLLSMGLTLFNCEDERGKTKKIESIEIVKQNEKISDTSEIKKKSEKIDSTIPIKTKSKKRDIDDVVVESMILTTGDIAVLEEKPNPIDLKSIKKTTQCNNQKTDSITIPNIIGDIMLEDNIEEEIIIGFIVVNQPPEFLDTPKQLTTEEKKTYFSDRIQEIIKENFNEKIGDSIGLKGKQRIFTQFKINETGEVENIKVRAPHPVFEVEAKRVINLLPKFIPGKQRGMAISVVYYLPITFIIDD